MKRNEDSLRHLWDNTKCINICITAIPEGEERKKGPEKILEEIVAENFPNMGKEIVKSKKHRVPGRINTRHIETHSNQADKN